MKNQLQLFLILIMGLAVLQGCRDRAPEASFTVETNGLTVTFTNTSLDAESYSWDFGDGNTSTEASPMHTYASSQAYVVTLKVSNEFGTHENSETIDLSSVYKKDGYVIVSSINTSGAVTYYGGHFDEIPSGDIDLTTQASYQRFAFSERYNEFLFGVPTNGDFGITKFAFDEATGTPIEIAEIPLLHNWGDMVIINDQLGFYCRFDVNELYAFNPSTMEDPVAIDMSQAKSFDDMDRQGYLGIYHNENTGKIYLPLIVDKFSTPAFYEGNEVYVEVVDVATQTWEKTIIHPDAQYPNTRGIRESVIDEEGNLYILCQGSYGLDGQIGAGANKGSRPQILKINTSSEFDTTFAFNPINAIGYENNFFQLMTSIAYGGNNKIYAIATATSDPPRLIELLQKLQQGTITAAENDELLALALYSETQKVVEIDIPTKAVRVVDNIPSTAGFVNTAIYNNNGKIIVDIFGDNGSFNGFYEINPSTNTGTPLFNVTGGGDVFQLIDISSSF